MDVSFECNVQLEKLNNHFETIKCDKYRSCRLSLWRNEFKEIVVSICKSPKTDFKFVLLDVKIHSKFLKEGKSTIVLLNHNIRLLLSNCPPTSLKKFFQVLTVKLFNYKKKIVSERKKLNQCKSIVLDEISPLNEKDINLINANHSKTIEANSLKSVLGKRKILANPTNVKPDLQSKKRIITLPSDLLNFGQKHVVNLIKQRKNIFFTGSAGTGKSYLLRHIIGMLPPSETFVTASTGVAACQIDGMTLHSFAGVHSVGPINNIISKVLNNKTLLKQWKTCKHLIIDEISMIDADLFDCIEAVARAICDNTKPFGGIQLIICGDFFQLPPVSKSKDNKNYCFQAKSWKTCIDTYYELQKIYRQTDSKFIDLLQDIRLGICGSKTTAILKATSLNKLGFNGIVPTKLCTHIENVKKINKSELDKLKGKMFYYEAQDSSDLFSSILDQYLPDSKLLLLKVGAQVMLTKNIDISKKLVNGARGIVIAFTKTQHPLPVVSFLTGTKQVVELETYSIKISSDVLAVRKQLPLKLGWAISIHKSQGMSLDCVEMSLSRVFEYGQAYVALSRATSFSGLRVLDFDASSVQSNIKVLRFYRELREQQRYLPN